MIKSNVISSSNACMYSCTCNRCTRYISKKSSSVFLYINPIKLIVNLGYIPFNNISNNEIFNAINSKHFIVIDNEILDLQYKLFNKKNKRNYDIYKIATIANEIKNNTYNYNKYKIKLYDDLKGAEIMPVYECSGGNLIFRYYNDKFVQTDFMDLDKYLENLTFNGYDCTENYQYFIRAFIICNKDVPCEIIEN
jgi:hypothetical protein